MIEITDNLAQLRTVLHNVRCRGKKIAFVPTMGNLHDGHLSLLEQAGKYGDYVVISIFVNPTQFGENEDLANYPRTLERDKKLIAGKVDLLFTPPVDVIYPHGNATHIDIPDLTGDLCGIFRPVHFVGVLTVVNLLFNLIQPQYACFGKKDLQQMRLVQRMVADLHLDIDIIEVETGREANGLAHSSRNQYLSAEEHKKAATISQVIDTICAAIRDGSNNYHQLCDTAKQRLQHAGFVVDYVTIRDSKTLKQAHDSTSLVVLVAARLGKTRLIDNKEVQRPA